jgi:predicted PhzF superfamily epimerase YddE/YHI9
MKPDMNRLKRMERPIIVTAPGRDCDFVSRFFAPTYGIDEDPVTGSAHCTLVPYWARRLGKSHLTARQLSARGGELYCEDRGDRVQIGGNAVCFMEGMIELP